MNNTALIEFSKTYKKMKKNNKDLSKIDDILDSLNTYLQSKQDDNLINKVSRNTYIENKLQETLCIASIYYGMEYDLSNSNHSLSSSSSENAYTGSDNLG